MDTLIGYTNHTEKDDKNETQLHDYKANQNR